MGYQPWLKKNAESTLIQFNRSDSSTYEKYTDQLKTFLSGIARQSPSGPPLLIPLADLLYSLRR